MKIIISFFIALLVCTAHAQFKPTPYDTNTDATAQAFVASQIGAQVGGSNYTTGAQIAGSNYTTSAQIAGSNYTTSTQIAGSNFQNSAQVTASVGAQVGGSNYLTGYQGTNLVNTASTNFALLSRQTVPLFYQTNITKIGGIYNSWPISARDTNGDYVVMFASGNRHTATNRSLYLTRSTNQGYSWNTPILAYTNGAIDVASPGFSFGISSSGRYILASAGTIVPANVVTQVVILYSDNQGASWTPATSFQSFTGYDNTNVPAGQVVTLSNSRLCMGYSGFSNSFDASVVFALTSDDNGLTWQTNFMATSTGSGFREPSFAYLGNSNVLCMVRRDQAFANQPLIFYQLHSTNNGTSWVQDGPVSMGFNTSQRQPGSMYAYGSASGRRVVFVYGNRETTQLEARDVSAWDTFYNLTNVWLYARPEILGIICPYQGDGGYGSPIGDGQSGDCIIPYYFSFTNNLTIPTNAEIRFSSRSARLAVPQNPQVLIYDTSINGVTNSTAETDMVSFTIPANTLYGSHAYDLLMTGFAFNNAASSVSNRVRVYFGSTVIYDQIMDQTVFAQGTGTRPYRFGATLKAFGSTSGQDLDGFWHGGSSVIPTVGLGNINSTAYGGGVFGNRVTLNAKTNNVFRVTFTLTPANTSLWFDHDLISVTYY